MSFGCLLSPICGVWELAGQCAAALESMEAWPGGDDARQHAFLMKYQDCKSGYSISKLMKGECIGIHESW